MSDHAVDIHFTTIFTHFLMSSFDVRQDFPHFIDARIFILEKI